jgi:hypothetical protein
MTFLKGLSIGVSLGVIFGGLLGAAARSDRAARMAGGTGEADVVGPSDRVSMPSKRNQAK